MKKVKVLIPNKLYKFTEVEVTNLTPEVYKITLVYTSGLCEEEIYRSFADEDATYSYAKSLSKQKVDCIQFFWELLFKVEF